MAEPTSKRKKPPSFPHVHPSRARKFKKAWVDKAKITSKWKAQKKREGLIEKAKLEIPRYGLEERVDPDTPNTSYGTEREEPRSANTRTKQTEESKSVKQPDDVDVRGLMREAYSKSTLHTFRSDPLKKRAALKGDIGKGQPNMKLRMNALLAKIKRDCA